MSVFDLLRDCFCDAWPGRQWPICLFGYRVGVIVQNQDASAWLYVRNEPGRHCPSVADACLYIRQRFETAGGPEVRFPRHQRYE